MGLRGERSGQTSYIFVTNSLNSDQPCTCTDPYMNTHRTGGVMKRALPAAANQSQQWPMQKTCRLVFLSYLDEHHEHSKSSFFAILLLLKAEARSQPQLCQFSSTTNFTLHPYCPLLSHNGLFIRWTDDRDHVFWGADSRSSDFTEARRR